MKAVVHLAQTLAGDVRVYLRGADAGVPEEFLNHTQVRAVFHEVRGKAVAEHVRGHVALDAGPRHARLDATPEGGLGKRCAALSEKHIGRRTRCDQFRPAHVQIMLQRFHCFFADGHHALLVAFANDSHETLLQVQLLQPEIAELGQPQTGGVGEFQDRRRAKLLGGGFKLGCHILLQSLVLLMELVVQLL